VSTSDAIDDAFWSAERTTLAAASPAPDDLQQEARGDGRPKRQAEHAQRVPAVAVLHEHNRTEAGAGGQAGNGRGQRELAVAFFGIFPSKFSR